MYDRVNKQAKFLFYNRDDLSTYTLASMEPVVFNARDGLKKEGYLTKPVDLKGPAPLVLLVHGDHGCVMNGDMIHKHNGLLFVAMSACSQLSWFSGYGNAFSNAGNKEWGRKMHHDLVDAVDWQ